MYSYTDATSTLEALKYCQQTLEFEFDISPLYLTNKPLVKLHVKIENKCGVYTLKFIKKSLNKLITIFKERSESGFGFQELCLAKAIWLDLSGTLYSRGFYKEDLETKQLIDESYDLIFSNYW